MASASAEIPATMVARATSEPAVMASGPCVTQRPTNPVPAPGRGAHIGRNRVARKTARRKVAVNVDPAADAQFAFGGFGPNRAAKRPARSPVRQLIKIATLVL